MVCGHAGAEANPILRDSWIVDRCDKQAAAPEFVTKLIHPGPIADHDRHDVGARSAGIDAERIQLRSEVLGIVPEPLTELRFARGHFQSLQHGADHNRGQSAGVHIWVRIVAQIIERLLRTGDEPAKRGECFREGPVDERDPMFDTKLFRGAAPILATREHRVRFINENAGGMRFGHVEQGAKLSEIAVH